MADTLGVSEQRTLEDLFDESYYVNHVNMVYRKELGGQPLAVPPEKNRCVVSRVEAALRAKGVDKFNKGRVAKRIMEEIPRKKLADLPKDTVENFGKVIAEINAVMAKWKSA